MSQDALGQLKHLKTARARWPFPDVDRDLTHGRTGKLLSSDEESQKFSSRRNTCVLLGGLIVETIVRFTGHFEYPLYGEGH